jgi:hypothetical protein
LRLCGGPECCSRRVRHFNLLPGAPTSQRLPGRTPVTLCRTLVGIRPCQQIIGQIRCIRPLAHGLGVADEQIGNRPRRRVHAGRSLRGCGDCATQAIQERLTVAGVARPDRSGRDLLHRPHIRSHAPVWKPQIRPSAEATALNPPPFPG